MRFYSAIFLLASVALTFAQDAVVSVGVVHGFDYSDPEATPLQVFRERRNHLVAVASLLKFQGELTHYTPHKQLPAKSTKAFKAFQEGIESSPLWSLTEMYTKWPTLEKGGLHDLQRAIENVLPNHDYGHEIAKQLVQMVPATVHDPNLKLWAFSILTLVKNPVPEDTITIGFGKLILNLELTEMDEDDDDEEEDNDGDFFIVDMDKKKKKKKSGDYNKKWKVSVPKQVADLDISEFDVNRKALVDNAERLAKQIPVVTLNGFQEFFTSSADSEEYSSTFDFAGDYQKQRPLACHRPRRIPSSYWF
ncbi:hypothetical protein BGZ73_001802 [Actinomortierella ambigua]|nr:hypothetical protein BGZ73_001802 [Actinomortierella ambigua]